jgi:hypothetical protein
MNCCVSTAKMVTRTRHNFTLYIHFLSRLITYPTVTFVETDSGVWYVRLCSIHTVRMTSLNSFVFSYLLCTIQYQQNSFYWPTVCVYRYISDDGGNIFRRNVWTRLPSYTTSCPIRTKCSTTRPWPHEYWQNVSFVFGIEPTFLHCSDHRLIASPPVAKARRRSVHSLHSQDILMRD